MNFETIVITAGVGSLAGWLIGLVIVIVVHRKFWNVETAAMP